MSLGDTFNPSTFGGKKTIVAFFTHAGDFNTFEFGEKLLHYLPQLDKAGVQLVAVTIGSPENARAFAELTGFPLDKLYCDPEAAAYKAYGFSRGFLPDVPINPYLKLLPMLAGIGSPGTIQAVLRGTCVRLCGVFDRDRRGGRNLADTIHINTLSLTQRILLLELPGYVGDKNADASWTSSYLKKDAGGLVSHLITIREREVRHGLDRSTWMLTPPYPLYYRSTRARLTCWARMARAHSRWPRSAS